MAQFESRSMLVSELPLGERKARAVEEMFDRIAPRYELVNRVMTLGLDAGWRRRAVRELQLEPGAWVIDLGCGTGDLCRVLGRAGLRAVGVDMAAGMLAKAHTAAPLVRADALQLPLRDASVDGAVSGFALRNVVDIAACFGEAARVIRPGGRAVFLEVSEPPNRLVRFAHSLYFRRIVPVVGGLLSDRTAYRYLPASTAYLPAPSELLALLTGAGFSQCRRVQLGVGAAQLLIGTRR
ncbi:MAG: ubiquinone/menaquinone biosynthesis methyltransferase [Candidatus Dormiibacterota bacterium]